MAPNKKVDKRKAIDSELGISNMSDRSESSDGLEKQNSKDKLKDNDSDSDDFADSDDDEHEHRVFDIQKKSGRVDNFKGDYSEDEDEMDEEGLSEDEIDEDQDEEIVEASTSGTKNLKLKKLTPDELAREQKKIKKTGVCYLSRIPPYMKPATLRSIFSRFGKIDRLFLKPEDNTTYHKRVKYGGNKKKNYTAGWIEYVKKKDAKLCAATLNGNKLGGRKTSYYYDDIINIKYLSGFKWFDLTQQIAKENEIRQSKLSMELSQQQKLNKGFINNVEKSKMINNIQRKRKARQESTDDNNEDIEVRRNLKQRNITSTRADANDDLKQKTKPNEKLNDVLSKVF